MLTLYTASSSANGRKTVALARQLRIAIQVVEVNVYDGEGQTPAFLALNLARTQDLAVVRARARASV